MDKNSIDATENIVETTELNTPEKAQEVNIVEKIEDKIIEKPATEEKVDKKVDIKNILNLDELQYNSLLEVLIQDTKFTQKFLERANQNSLGQKKERDEKGVEIQKMPVQYEDSPKIEVIEDNNGLHQEEYNVNGITLAEGPEDDEIYIDERDRNKENGYEIERDKILEDDMYYNRLLKLVRQYKINKVLNIIIDLTRNRDIKYRNYDEEYIKREIINITKISRKELLIFYLMKIMSNNTNTDTNINTNVSTINNKEPTRMPPAPKKYQEKYIETPKIYDNFDNMDNFDNYDNFDINDNDFNENDNKKKLEHTKVIKRKKPEPDYQYRGKHFVNKNGIIFCFFPKNRTNSARYTLYCTKRSCNARLKIDMSLKKILVIGEHIEHEGINIEKFKWEYPEVAKKDWKHLQYDCFHGKKILVWKF